MKTIILGISMLLSVSSAMASSAAYTCRLVNSKSGDVLSQGTASSSGGFKERIRENGKDLIFKIQISKDTFYLNVLTSGNERVISADVTLNAFDELSPNLNPKFMSFRNTENSLGVYCSRE